MFFEIDLVFFSNGIFHVLEYIQCTYVHSLKKILMFILYINIPMCWTFVNINIIYFKISSYVCMKNYYRNDMFKIFFLMSWVYEIFVNVCWHLWYIWKKNGNHVLKFMICGRQVLTFILAN
jgi:hypothetical protein